MLHATWAPYKKRPAPREVLLPRLFIALSIPETDLLGLARQSLVAAAPKARLVAGANHATLRFLGNADRGEVEGALRRAIEGCPPQKITVAGAGAFQDARCARVAWLGIHGDGLAELACRIAQATAHIGRPPGARDFVGHLTLACLEQPADLRDWVSRWEGTTFWAGRIGKVTLYESHLGGAVRHEAVCDFALGAS